MIIDFPTRSKIKWPVFCGYNSKEIKWFRIFGFGMCFKCDRLNFSERYGYKKIRKINTKWRYNFLKRKKEL